MDDLGKQQFSRFPIWIWIWIWILILWNVEHEWWRRFEHRRRLRGGWSIRAWRSFAVWWERCVPTDDAISHARLPQRTLHLRECFASLVPLCTLGSLDRCLPAAFVRHANWIGARMLVRAIRSGHGPVFARHVSAGHPHGHHHAPSGVRRSGQSFGSTSQIGGYLHFIFM